MATQILTQAMLKDVLRYEPSTGHFYWIKPCNRFSQITVGAKAGTLHKRGYVHIKVYGKSYKAHRLAWLYTHGRWPNPAIDHINQVKSDNRIENLREADQLQNMQNKPKYRTNSSGYIGVTWHKDRKKWLAQFAYCNKNHYLGLFDDPAEAAKAYALAKQRITNANANL